MIEDTQNENQVISKQRVVEHGEVFTAQREVNAMLDLVKQETERIDSRFLEPACGTGNFLVEILKRKLAVVESRYGKSQIEYELYAIIALASIYGIDIQQDNVQSCRERLLGIFTSHYIQHYKEVKSEFLATAKFILSKNIIWGDALSLTTPDENAKPIVFSEWSAVTDYLINRRDYTLDNLLKSQPPNGLNLFSGEGETAFPPPEPVAEYPLTYFLELAKNDTNKL